MMFIVLIIKHFIQVLYHRVQKKNHPRHILMTLKVNHPNHESVLHDIVWIFFSLQHQEYFGIFEIARMTHEFLKRICHNSRLYYRFKCTDAHRQDSTEAWKRSFSAATSESSNLPIISTDLQKELTFIFNKKLSSDKSSHKKGYCTYDFPSS